MAQNTRDEFYFVNLEGFNFVNQSCGSSVYIDLKKYQVSSVTHNEPLWVEE